ncbi:B3/B4 domain-containing protein [Tenggerimyces flavus]|uniref:B3/4 domain-containing protein n=1 Tax=Tenggerimyces flavus TaxID=1708749 RepID=A0ABV7YEI7_9ACTN|nr:phenylalanine--tRNA ligase beta subunit-related protein [Tenggerimyces flavus]MBM7788127.1 DNA/RNA-binding domain of Phe-tRNA-synthetase-like protein [Tenggerimyces flavus]
MSSTFQHSSELWRDYPALVAGVVRVDGITADVSVSVDSFYARASERLASSSESELPEIRAWRRTFSSMGLKPTQYRCASEALLRRFKKESALPSIHPLIDVCNAISLAYAIPVAVFDLAHVVGSLEVRRAVGSELYLTFGGTVESPETGEVIFADADGQAHARRWTNRQSARSAIQPSSSRVLIVAEALHSSADKDVAELVASVVSALGAAWSVAPRSAVLSAAAPSFDL